MSLGARTRAVNWTFVQYWIYVRARRAPLSLSPPRRLVKGHAARASRLVTEPIVTTPTRRVGEEPEVSCPRARRGPKSGRREIRKTEEHRASPWHDGLGEPSFGVRTGVRLTLAGPAPRLLACVGAIAQPCVVG